MATTITTNQLEGQKPLNLATPQNLIPTYQNALIGATTQLGQDSQEAIALKTAEQDVEKARQQAMARSNAMSTLESQIGGKGQDLLTEQKNQGYDTAQSDVMKYAQQLADINAQASSLNREAQAIPLMEQNRAIGTGRVQGQVEQISSQNLRDNALKALSLAQQADITSASLTGSQLRLQAAKDKAEQIVNLKYAQKEADLKALETNLNAMDKYVLSPAQEKRKEAQQALVAKQKADLEAQKDNELAVNNVAMTLRKYGVSDNIVRDVLNTTNLKDALIKAGNNLRDPKAVLELQELKTDIALKQAQILKTQREAQLSKEPSLKEKKEQAQAVASKQASAQAAQLKLESIDNILSYSQGIRSRVGTNALARGVVGPAIGGAIVGAGAGPIGAGVGALAGGAVGISSALSGQGQQLSGAVHQLTQGLTLQNLIDAKKNGATFGALTGPELQLLANSATKLNDWEIKDKNGNPTGYWNIDEASFRKEISEIQRLTRKALQDSQQGLITPEEQQVLDDIYGTDEASASQYFQ